MVSIPPENFRLSIGCPDCGKEANQSLARLRRYRYFRCMGCGQIVRMDGNGTERLEAAVVEFEKEVAKIEFFMSPNGLTQIK